MDVDAMYGDLSEVESDPRYLRLCTHQAKALSALTAKHAQERVRLALVIRREVEAARSEAE